MRVVCRPQQVTRLREIAHRVALEVREIASGYHVHPQLVQVHGMALADTESAGSTLGGSNSEIDVQLALDLRKQRLDAVDARAAHDLTDK